MKILTAKEQLTKEAETAWKSYQTLYGRETKLGRKIFSYEQRWIKNPDKLRMMKYERDELQTMASQLASYTNMLTEQAKQL